MQSGGAQTSQMYLQPISCTYGLRSMEEERAKQWQELEEEEVFLVVVSPRSHTHKVLPIQLPKHEQHQYNLQRWKEVSSGGFSLHKEPQATKGC